MALWDELKADVITWTSRADLVAETELALRNAIRTAHRAAHFWRDLVKVPNIATAVAAVQTINLAVSCPAMKQIAKVKSGTTDKEYDFVGIRELLDNDGLTKSDVYWGFGTELNIRSSGPEETYEIWYYKYPVIYPTAAYTDWIADQDRDVIIALAAVSILGSVGEQEIARRLESLSALNLDALIKDNVNVLGR